MQHSVHSPYALEELLMWSHVPGVYRRDEPVVAGIVFVAAAADGQLVAVSVYLFDLYSAVDLELY